MIHSIIEWWADMSRRSKYLFCLAVLAVDVIFYLNGTIWIWGWAIGVVLLLCTFFGVGEEWD